MPTFDKDPEAVLDYGVDWSDWLPTGDTINTSTWDADTGITIDSDTFTDTTTTVWLSGGTTTLVYRVTNRITTTEGRTQDQTITVRIKEL